jgi:hypothetical protein
MTDWASSGRIKIERANEHIRNLEAEIVAFRERRPYPVFPQADPNSDSTLYIVRVREEIPSRWSAITADALHNLHVALEYIWLQAMPDDREGHFPAYADPESAKARFNGKEKGRSKVAVDIFNRVDAFKVGNPFWAIRCFDDTDKHETISLVAFAREGLEFDDPPMLWRFAPSFPLFVVKDGAPVFRLPPTASKLDVNIYLTFYIAFGEGEVLTGDPVVPTLQNLAASVESLAAAFIEAGLLI